MAQIKALKNIPGRMIGRLTRIECGSVIDVPDETAAQLILIEYAAPAEDPAPEAPAEAAHSAPTPELDNPSDFGPARASGDEGASQRPIED